MILRHGRPVSSLAVLADGRLASGGYDGLIKIWPQDGVGEPVIVGSGSRPPRPLVVLADGRLASGEDGQIKLWPRDGADGEPMILSHGSQILALVVLPGCGPTSQRWGWRPGVELGRVTAWASR